MPKLSVYLPDDLWEQARSSLQHENISQLIQEALRRMLDERAPPAFAQTPPDIDSKTSEALRERLLHEARDLYNNGYAEGIRLAEELDWSQLDRLAAVNWDVARWQRTGDDIGDLLFKGEELQMALHGYDMTPPTAHTRGWLDALKHVWGAVAHGADSSVQRDQNNEAN